MTILQDKIKEILIDESERIDNCNTYFPTHDALMKIMRAIDKERPLMPVAIDFVRPTVDWYAKRMEKRLKEKDAIKGEDNWHDGDLFYYLAKATDCMEVITKIVEPTFIRVGMTQKESSDIKEKNIHLVIKKCIDGGNFFMMLADNLRDELIKRGIKKVGNKKEGR